MAMLTQVTLDHKSLSSSVSFLKVSHGARPPINYKTKFPSIAFTIQSFQRREIARQKGSVLGTHVEKFGNVYTNMTNRKLAHVTPHLLQRVYSGRRTCFVLETNMLALDTDPFCAGGDKQFSAGDEHF